MGINSAPDINSCLLEKLANFQLFKTVLFEISCNNIWGGQGQIWTSEEHKNIPCLTFEFV